MSEPQLVTISSEALGMTECRLEGFDKWKKRWLSLTIFAAVVLVPCFIRLHWCLKMLVVLVGTLSYVRFFNNIEYESVVIRKGSGVFLDTQWKYFKHRRKLPFKELTAIYLHEVSEQKFNLVFYADEGIHFLGCKHTKPPGFVLGEVFSKIHDQLPRRLKQQGLGILQEHHDFLEAAYDVLSTYITCEIDYYHAGTVWLWEGAKQLATDMLQKVDGWGR